MLSGLGRGLEAALPIPPASPRGSTWDAGVAGLVPDACRLYADLQRFRPAAHRP